ncbi:chemotaxis protein CheW [Magnetospirillum sp. SS-4]|uniref:chemotaxis protein CheW n=1 Tax=Magnetospirillum sp. SS-4 TaxID=2681465 RepID=UPI001382354A|nr:chemotaxis protein CheW [Magnetospirillum sp. SS-4]CAA7624922.1 Chemotaxis signal transduction protein [Magnetospirillum sp. SS-4]
MTTSRDELASASLRRRLQARIEWGGNDRDSNLNTALLKARALRLARPRDVAAERESGIQVLSFRIAAERYALALSCLSEVMPLTAWTPVPGQPQYLLGITNLWGEIRPVLDLHSLFGLEPPGASTRCWVIFVKHGRSEVGLRVEGLDSIRAIDPAGLTDPHISGNGLPQRFIRGIGADTLILLDIPQILALDVLRDSRADATSAP